MAKTQLLDLPAELLEKVAEQSDDQDLKDFRSTCRELHAATDRTFIKTFFTDRTHVVTKYSLETLVSITASPRLRSQLKSVMLATHIFLPVIDHSLQAPAPMSVEELLASLEGVKSAPYEEKSQQLEAGLFGEYHVALASVVTILNNLRTAGIVPTLGVNVGDEAFGRRQLAEMIGLDPLAPSSYHFIVYGDKMQTTEMLLRAIGDTRLQIDGLELLGPYEGAGGGVVADDMWRLSHLRQFFSSLVSLGLDCGDVVKFAQGMRNTFMAALESPIALQHLSLSHLGCSAADKHLFVKIITTCARFDLKSIKLQHFSATPREMRNLLTPHRKTLESLELDNVHTKASDVYTVRSFFTTLAADYSLRKLNLRRLWEDDREMESYSFNQGPGQVLEGLQELAKKDDLFVPMDY